jgi:hypothetical protein
MSTLALLWAAPLHNIRPWATLGQHDGIGLSATPLTLPHQQADPMARLDVMLPQQEGIGLPSTPLMQRHQDGYRDRRYSTQARHQQGQSLQIAHAASAGRAAPLAPGWGGRYQAARRPPAGVYVRPSISPMPVPCYTPGGLLLFDALRALDGLLLFVCERKSAGSGASSGQTLVIPLLKVYMTVHHLEAVLLPGGEHVTLFDVALSADADNPGWSLSASGPEYLLDQLGGTRVPKQIKITIDGLPWVFAIERINRTRSPGQRRAQLSAVSTTMLLGAPYMPAQTWLNDQELSAQQLVLDTLQTTGLNLDWPIPDWLIAPGVWSFTGTPLAAAVRVAQSVGAVLQSDPVAPMLRYLPRYPLMPWEWSLADTPADVSLPSAAILTDSLERNDQPQWEAVYVMGTTQGVMTRLKRTGTARSLLAPQGADDLITHVDAARQRGRAILGAGGPQANVTLPLLPGSAIGQSGPGLLCVGDLLEVVEPDQRWRALVRGVSVSASFASGQLRQSLRVERHF